MTKRVALKLHQMALPFSDVNFDLFITSKINQNNLICVIFKIPPSHVMGVLGWLTYKIVCSTKCEMLGGTFFGGGDECMGVGGCE